MTPSCPSSKRRSSGRWKRSTRLRGCEGFKERTVKDSGTGGEGLGLTLAVLLQQALGKPGAEGSSLLCASCFASGSRFTPRTCQWEPGLPLHTEYKCNVALYSALESVI